MDMDAEMKDEFWISTGERVCVGDFVCLSPADPHAELYVARIDRLYHDEERKRWIQIRWYYRPKELQHEPPSSPLKNEVYYTKYSDCQLLESIAKICKVFTKSEYFELNEEQKRPVSEEDIFFYEYVYSAENGSFTKMSRSGDAHLQHSFAKQASPDASIKILIHALLDLEEHLTKDAIPACWADERLRWIAKVKESKIVQNIIEGLLYLADYLQLIRGIGGKNEYKSLLAWKKAVTADSLPESLLRKIEHLQTLVQQRNSRTEKKRKRCRSEQEKKKDKLPLLQGVREELDDKLPLLQGVREELDDLEKKGERIKEGSIYEINHTCLPPKAPIHLKYIQAVLVEEKTNTHVRVKFPSILALRNYFGTDKNIEQNTQHPSLDEQFVMGRKLAERVLSRRIPSTEYIMQRQLESFWVISGDPANERLEIIRPAPQMLEETPTDGVEDVKLTNVEGKELIKIEGTLDVKFSSDVEVEGDKVPIKWGLRRKVTINRKHRSMEKGDEQTSTDGESLETRTKVPRKRRRYTVNEDDMATSPSPGEKSSMLRLPKEMQGRWTGERYRAAQLKLLAIMREKEAVPGKPILRPALREEARKHIGDTGLLDHLLKHMTDTVIKDGERFRRRHNAEGAMEYWLEPADFMELRKQAGIQDPWWIPPPGWQPGDKVSLNGCVAGMTPSEAEEMKALREELINLKSELLSWRNMNVNEGKKMIQEENHDILKETLQELQMDVKKLIKDAESIQTKSLVKENKQLAEAETSQIDCQDETTTAVRTTDHKYGPEASISSHKFWSRCNIVERLEKLETETYKKFQEMESNHRAEKKHLEDKIAKVTESMERMQEEMGSFMKSVENSKVAPTKKPSSEQSLFTHPNHSKGNINVGGNTENSSGKARAEPKELNSESKACKGGEKQPRTGFRICKPEGTFMWPNMTPKSSTRVPLKDILLSPRQLQVPAPASTNKATPFEQSLHKTATMDAKDITVSAGMSSAVVVYKSRSKGVNGQKDTCDTELSLSPKSHSQVEGGARQKELISMYISHLTTPELQWAQNQMMGCNRSPVPDFMSDQIVWPVPSQSLIAHATGNVGGGGFHVAAPECSRTAPCQSSWLGLAPPAASSAPHNVNKCSTVEDNLVLF